MLVVFYQGVKDVTAKMVVDDTDAQLFLQFSKQIPASLDSVDDFWIFCSVLKYPNLIGIKFERPYEKSSRTSLAWEIGEYDIEYAQTLCKGFMNNYISAYSTVNKKYSQGIMRY
ncbi:hypothetical protein J3Q64DRAFT_1698871 [Phycomyces blakesleeanus]|uniref:Uncharacterized protein n=1 Tax=Phycomyces blakesleeanus TaxID=4837 RepID=A0ABR3AYS5_PHYBL